MPVGATPTASQEAADGGASSRRRRRWAKWGEKKMRRKFNISSPNFSTQAFEHFAPRSETTDEKEFGGWKIPKASNNNRCAPGGRNWEIDGWRKNRRFLFSSSGAAPHRTRHASRETAQHPASFRRFQPSRQAIETKAASIPGNDSARQRQMPPPRKPKIKEERHDPDL